MNWNEMKEFCNGLTEEQLCERVLLHGEDTCDSIGYVEVIPEDYMYHEGDLPEYGCIPESEVPDEAKSKYKVAYAKGFPVLYLPV